ncbi:hypothetical protein GCM10023189_38650 [Nibrella saemangeumensis]|uniref:FecR family protein n=1 Tax=Nibrella saemangeumensis TaxID=1084526 RepID=A0ABP8NAU8_9BACT
MDNSVNKHTLFEHFAGRITPIQRKLIEDWLQTPTHRELYYEWLEEWERLNLQYAADDQDALTASLAQIDAWQQQQPTTSAEDPLDTNRFRLSFRWVAAATVVLVALATLLYANRTHLLYRTIETAYGEIRKETLPDGSVVTLNAHSSLRVPRFGFGQRTREVYLTGEAAFSVTHTPDDQQFVVKTARGFDVVVLGTEFTVSARQRDAKVVLNQGKVQVKYYANAEKPRELTMKPGELMKLNPAGTVSVKQIPKPENHSAWQEHRFVFDQTSLTEIANLLHENYGLTVEIREPALAERTVSGSFQAKTADELLQVIAELLEINFNRQNDTVTFFE